jgi:acyl-CoA synthetase (NDP forming)
MEMGKTFPDLTRLVQPRNILVVGGSQKQNSEGARLLENLSVHSQLAGEILVVNPKMASDERFRCWQSVADVPDVDIDVALVMVRAELAMQALRECAARRVPFAIVMSSGFGELGDEGKSMEAEIRGLCADSGMRVYGPNCPGLTNLRDRIGMTFSPAFRTDINAGPIGVVTQGGGSGRNILQGLSFGVGAALWLSAGNEVDLGAPDFIAHMARDPQIRVIAVLLEGIHRGDDLAAALELARTQRKPVVIMKLGRTEYGVRAAQSHTGSIAGTAEVNSAVFRQFGAIEVDDLDELVAVARLLALPQRPASAGVAVVTFSGGAAGMAADQAGIHRLELAKLAPATVDFLRSRLPAFAATQNPVDVTADALKNMDAIAACLNAVADDPAVGAVVVPVPADYAAVTDTIAQAVVEASKRSPKPFIPVWMSRRLGGGFHVLEEGGLAPFMSLSKAFQALKKVIPARAADETQAQAAARVDVPAGPTATIAYNEASAKHMLRTAGIAVPEGVLAKTPAQASQAAAHLGCPVVLKVASAQILHKTEVGAVRLDIRSPEQAEQAFAEMVARVGSLRPDAVIDGVLVEKMFDGSGREMLVGIHTDPVFGRILTVGLGGIFVELFKDVAHRRLPIGKQDAAQMLGELRHAAYLGEFRGRPAADIRALADLLVQLSQFAMANPQIVEAELNPVWVGPAGQGAYALDALILANRSN